MNLRCPRCGEPWDFDTLHDRVAELNAYQDPDDGPVTYEKVAADFRARGCEALGDRCYTVDQVLPLDGHLSAAEAAEALYELLGDDMDGAAAMLEDLGY